MDGFNAYSFATAAWLTLQSVPLMLTPSIVETLLSSDVHRLTALEEYFSRSLGIALLALSLLCLLLTGSIPLTTTASDPIPRLDENIPPNPYATATLIITTLYHSTTAFYGYARYTVSGQSAFLLGAIGSGALAAMGLWVVLFGRSSHISRRTGADKRTSGWPFRNAEADRKRVPKKSR